MLTCKRLNMCVKTSWFMSNLVCYQTQLYQRAQLNFYNLERSSFLITFLYYIVLYYTYMIKLSRVTQSFCLIKFDQSVNQIILDRDGSGELNIQAFLDPLKIESRKITQNMKFYYFVSYSISSIQLEIVLINHIIYIR